MNSIIICYNLLFIFVHLIICLADEPIKIVTFENERYDSLNKRQSNQIQACSHYERCVPLYDCPTSWIISASDLIHCVSKSYPSNNTICCADTLDDYHAEFLSNNVAIEPDSKYHTDLSTMLMKPYQTQLQPLNYWQSESKINTIAFDTSGGYHSKQVSYAEQAHSSLFDYNPVVNRLANNGEILLNLSITLFKNKKYKHKNQQLSKHDLWSEMNVSKCPELPECELTRYHSADGSCNNLIHSNWGQALNPFERLLKPDYEDEMNLPRVSSTGNALPNARLLSISLSPCNQHRTMQSSKKFTLALMQFGQFLDHDLMLTALTRNHQGESIFCCNNGKRGSDFGHPACMPINLHANDPFFGPKNHQCMNFVRSAAATRLNCELGPREQINQVTPIIDGSMLYGSSKARQNLLRSFVDGQLMINTGSVRGMGPLLPSQQEGSCNVPIKANQCFRSGDNRVNENVQLTLYQTIFMRLHNCIANQLSLIHSNWPDHVVFQETRRIVVGIIQHITYNEFLPAILGHNTVKKYGLIPSNDGLFSGYQKNVNPSIFGGFSTAAFRFHSIVQGTLQLIDNEGHFLGTVPLVDTFNNPTLLRKVGMLDALINGMTSQAQQEMDQLFTDQLQNHLFQSHNASFGLDLIAINIQRGRDHGIPSYNRWRKACGLSTFKSFAELKKVMPKSIIDILKQHYVHVEDVDLFVAGVSEYHVKDALIGPTFSCIVAEQFRRLKIGDRFYYENQNQESSFTSAQKKAIKTMTMSRIFCDHGDSISTMQPYAFIKPIFWWNKKVPCKNIPKFNLDPWFNSNVLG